MIHIAKPVGRNPKDIDKLLECAWIRQATENNQNAEISRIVVHMATLSTASCTTAKIKYFTCELHFIHQAQEVYPPESESKEKKCFMLFPPRICGSARIEIEQWIKNCRSLTK